MKKIPLRKCVITKESLSREELFRVVRTPEGEVKFDITNRLNGRGAYLKRDEEVILKAKKSKILDRILEAEVTDEVYQRMINYLKMK